MSRDPTQTVTLRRRLKQRANGRLNKFIKVVRTLVLTNAILKLGREAAGAKTPELDALSRAVEEAVQDVQGEENDQNWLFLLLVLAYIRGMERGGVLLGGIGQPTNETFTDFQRRIHQEEIAGIKRRYYRDFGAILVAYGGSIDRLADQATTEDWTPQRLYQEIREEDEKIRRRRVYPLVAAAIILAFNRGLVNQLFYYGITEFDIIPEFDVVTAGDSRVCKRCKRLRDDGPYSYEEALGLLPLHPRCRCTWAISAKILKRYREVPRVRSLFT